MFSSPKFIKRLIHCGIALSIITTLLGFYFCYLMAKCSSANIGLGFYSFEAGDKLGAIYFALNSILFCIYFFLGLLICFFCYTVIMTQIDEKRKFERRNRMDETLLEQELDSPKQESTESESQS